MAGSWSGQWPAQNGVWPAQGSQPYPTSQSPAGGAYPYQSQAGYQVPANQGQPGVPQQAGYPDYTAQWQQYYAQQSQQTQHYGANLQQGYQQWPQAQYQQPYSAPQNSYPVAYQQPQVPPTIAPSVVPPTTGKATTCINCGDHNHWAANCPRKFHAAVYPSAPAPSIVQAPVKVQASGKGPVVTKYAVPPHIAAQMKARGVLGAPPVAPVAPYVQGITGHPSANQIWQSPTPVPYQQQVYPQSVSPPNLNKSSYGSPSILIQSSSKPPLDTNLTQTTPPETKVAEVVPPQIESGSITQSPVALKEAEDTANEKETTTVVESTVEEAKPQEEEDEQEEDDLTLLDIPDLPKSHGTAEYDQPKLVTKPVSSLAPEWAQSGLEEVSLSKDPEGKTMSNYLKGEDIEAEIVVKRTAAHEADPVFAEIDLNAPATIQQRPDSRDSGRSQSETPQTYESEDTRPTSVDDHDYYDGEMYYRRSRSPPSWYHHPHDGQRSPRRYSSNQSHNHHPSHPNKRRKNRKGRDRRGAQPGNPDGNRKRKREANNSEQSHKPDGETKEHQVKKHQPEAVTNGHSESVA